MAAYGSAAAAAMIASVHSVPWKFEELQGSRNCEVSQLGAAHAAASDSAKTTVFMSSSARGNLNRLHKANVWTNSAPTDFNFKSSLSSSFWGRTPMAGSQRGKLRATRRPHRDASRPQARPGSIWMPFTVDARLFGPSIFNASKLRVLLPGSGLANGSRLEQSDAGHAQDQEHGRERLLQSPRIYTLTHSDVTATITLTVAREINKAQVTGWYSRFQRDEVVAEWRRTKGEMSLQVHCHVSGTNFLHRVIAKLRFYIFQKELPLVLEAIIHGDTSLFEKHPELLNAPVWVYYHSDVVDFNRVECWGSLVDATKRGILLASSAGAVTTTNESDSQKALKDVEQQQFPGAAVCLVPCECCSRHAAVIPIPESLNMLLLLQSQAMAASQSREAVPGSTTTAVAALAEIMIAPENEDSSHREN